MDEKRYKKIIEEFKTNPAKCWETLNELVVKHGNMEESLALTWIRGLMAEERGRLKYFKEENERLVMKAGTGPKNGW
jgi:hypothetical protein